MPKEGDTEFLSISPDFGCAAAVGQNGVDFWKDPLGSAPDAADSKQLQPDISLTHPEKLELNQISRSPDGRLLAVWGGGPWNAIYRKSVGSQTEAMQAVSGGDLKKLADAGKQQMARMKAMAESAESPLVLYSACNGELIADETLAGYVVRARFSTSGDLLAAITDGGILHLVDARNGESLGRIEHDAPLRSVAVTSDGAYVAVGTSPGAIHVYHVASQQEVVRFEHQGVVSDLEFSADDRLLFSGSFDRTARLWKWHPEDMLANAHARIFRNLTPDEWAQYFPETEYRKTFEDR
jgi:WD40 repeat protein